MVLLISLLLFSLKTFVRWGFEREKMFFFYPEEEYKSGGDNAVEQELKLWFWPEFSLDLVQHVFWSSILLFFYMGSLLCRVYAGQ